MHLKIHDNGPNDEGGQNSRFAEKCLYAMLNHPLPITNQELDELLTETVESTDDNEKWTRESLIKSKSKERVSEENPNFFNTIIPLNCSITIDGISGIFFGNSFTLDGIPQRYHNKTAFQVTNVAHSIDSNGWQTTIQGLMRPIPADLDPEKCIRMFDGDTIDSYRGIDPWSQPDE